MKQTIFLIILLALSSGVLAECIDINSASLEELEKITWVGPSTAQKIVDARPFESVDDLDKVKGIGEVKLNDIKSEGLACVSDKKDSEETPLAEKGVSKNKTRIPSEIPEELIESPIESNLDSPILLNSPVANRELVYESRNAKMLRYLPYAFSLFLILVIVIILIDK